HSECDDFDLTSKPRKRTNCDSEAPRDDFDLNSKRAKKNTTCHSEEPRDEESASGFAPMRDKRIRK
ncbi:MAG TPA: hypothetical protein VKS00_00780, partial [Candidatus Acidoferrales bacterium]|nr:hypothetical protein [Candidatus Acidoferrales bacterium]